MNTDQYREANRLAALTPTRNKNDVLDNSSRKLSSAVVERKPYYTNTSILIAILIIIKFKCRVHLY